MRHFIIILALLTHTFNSYSQFSEIDLYVGTNYSLIGDQLQENTNVSGTNTGFGVVTSGNLGVEETFNNFFGLNLLSRARFSLSNKLSARIGLGFNYVKFERNTRVLGSDGNTFSQNLQNGFVFIDGLWQIDGDLGDLAISNPEDLILADPEKGPAHVVYLSIPLALQYQITARIYTSVGISVASRIYSRTKGDVLRFDTDNRETVVEERTYSNGEGLNGSQFFGSIGFGYRISEKLGFELNFQKGLSPIFEKDAQVAGKAKHNLLGLGLSYRLLKVVPKN